MANAICAQLLLLAAEDPDKDICLYINSPGGSVRPAWRSTTRCSSSRTTSRPSAMGLAASMGQFLLCAGAPRASATRCRTRAIMMHQPSRRHRWHRVRHQDPGRADAAHQEADGRADRPPHRPDRRADRRGLRPRPWFSAEDAKDYGFVDHVVTSARECHRRRRHRLTRQRRATSPHGQLGGPTVTAPAADTPRRRRATSCPASSSARRRASGSTTPTQALRGAHHLPRRADRRRVGRRRHGAAAVPGVDGPRPRHLASTSTRPAAPTRR